MPDGKPSNRTNITYFSGKDIDNRFKVYKKEYPNYFSVGRSGVPTNKTSKLSQRAALVLNLTEITEKGRDCNHYLQHPISQETDWFIEGRKFV